MKRGRKGAEMKKKKAKFCVWVIEVFLDDEWQPCAEAAINRQDGRVKLGGWKTQNPDDKFRIAQYVREEK